MGSWLHDDWLIGWFRQVRMCILTIRLSDWQWYLGDKINLKNFILCFPCFIPPISHKIRRLSGLSHYLHQQFGFYLPFPTTIHIYFLIFSWFVRFFNGPGPVILPCLRHHRMALSPSFGRCRVPVATCRQGRRYMWWNNMKYWDPTAIGWSLHLSKIVKAFVFNLKKQREIMGNPFLFGPWAGGVFWDSVIFPDNRFLDEVNVVLTPKCRYDGDTTNKTNTIWVILVYLELLDLLPFFRAVSIGRNDVTKPSWRLGWPWTAQQLGILVHQKTGNSCTNVWNPHSLKLYMHHCVFSWWIPHVCYVNYPFYPFSIGNSPICIYKFVIYIYMCII